MKIKTNQLTNGAVTITRETVISVTKADGGLAHVVLCKNGKTRCATWGWNTSVSMVHNGFALQPLKKAESAEDKANRLDRENWQRLLKQS